MPRTFSITHLSPKDLLNIITMTAAAHPPLFLSLTLITTQNTAILSQPMEVYKRLELEKRELRRQL